MQNFTNGEIPKEQPTDFLSWFRREFLRRKNRNSGYSVRAFAKYLDIAAPTVSHLLAGKRKPSERFTTKLFGRLDVTPDEKKLVLSSLRIQKAKERSAQTPASFHLIAQDAYKLIADWQHYAILELISVKQFKYDPTWIGQQLDISVTEVRDTIERLVRLKLVIKKNNTLSRSNSFVTNYEEGLTNSALKQLQRFVLQRALDAIDTVPPEEKDITSMTMAIDERKIPEAKRKIKQFRRELCAFLEDGEQTRVFNLGIQLYPISKESKKRGDVK